MPSRMLDGKVAIITGGASGLGRILVDMFVEEGARVLFTYRNSESSAELLQKLYGESVCAIKADASSPVAAENSVKHVIERFGRLDVLVNNACSARHKAFLKLNPDDIEYTFRNAFLPAYNYTRAVAPFMMAQQSGAIVSIGSINGERGREGSMPYCAAKAAVEGMNKTVAKELGEYGVTCNVVAPGYIATDGQDNTSPLIQKLVLNECAIRRLTDPRDVGNLIVFLVSDKARNITGQVYRIDCGQYI